MSYRSVARALEGSPIQGFLGSIASRYTGHIIGRALGVTTNAATRALEYRLNRSSPNIIPDVSEFVDLYYSRVLSWEELTRALKMHGIELDTGSTQYRDLALTWSSVIRNSAPHLPLELLRKMALQDPSTAPMLQSAMAREGLPLPAQFAAFLGEKENVPLSTLLNLLLADRITLAEFYRRARMLGMYADEADIIRSATWERPNAAQSLLLYRLGTIDAGELAVNLTTDGFVEADTQARLLTLNNTVPSPSDVIGSYGRISNDPGFAARWSLDAERGATYDLWMQRLGLNHSSGGGPFGEPDPAADTWGTVFWRDHWRLFDLGTLRSIIQRFRGDPADPATWSNPDVQPLAGPEVDRLLAANGIPPNARPYVLALTYQPIGIRHLRMIMRYNRQPRDWLIARYQDNGFKPDDAAVQADALIANINEQEAAPILAAQRAARRRFLSSVIVGYKGGAIDGPGLRATVIAQGYGNETADLVLQTANIELNTGIIRAVSARAKSDLYSGRTNLAGVTQRLLSTGADPQWVQLTVNGWQAAFGEGRRHIATDKVLKLLRKGYISGGEALQRLNYLGWAQADELLLLAEVQDQINQDAADAADAADLATQKQVAALNRMLKQNAANASKLQGMLRKKTPPASIMKWVKRGLWTTAQATARLQLMGYDAATIAVMLKEAAVEQIGGPSTVKARQSQANALLRRLYPPSRTVSFYRDGIWTRAEAESKLLAVGVPADEAAALLAQADEAIKDKAGA